MSEAGMTSLVELLERYQPGISAGFVPAAEKEIATLQRAVGPLPGAYLRFLRTMGSSTGDLELRHGDTKLTSVMKVWSTYNVLRWLARPPFTSYLFVAQDRSPSGYHFFLDRNAPHGADDCMLVQMPTDPAFKPAQRSPVHAGLEEFLFHEAYAAVRLPLFPLHEYQVSVPGVEDDVIAAIAAVAARLGFERLPSTTRSPIFERGDEAVLLHRPPESESFWMTVSAYDRAAIDGVVTAVGDIWDILPDDEKLSDE